MSKWQSGARAEIMVSEHPNNTGRIVTLMRTLWRDDKMYWAVEDGEPFTAYHPDAHYREPPDERKMKTSDVLAIEQWKLRLCDENAN